MTLRNQWLRKDGSFELIAMFTDCDVPTLEEQGAIASGTMTYIGSYQPQFIDIFNLVNDCDDFITDLLIKVGDFTTAFFYNNASGNYVVTQTTPALELTTESVASRTALFERADSEQIASLVHHQRGIPIPRRR